MVEVWPLNIENGFWCHLGFWQSRVEILLKERFQKVRNYCQGFGFLFQKRLVYKLFVETGIFTWHWCFNPHWIMASILDFLKIPISQPLPWYLYGLGFNFLAGLWIGGSLFWKMRIWLRNNVQTVQLTNLRHI